MKKNLIIIAVAILAGILVWGVGSYLARQQKAIANQQETITTTPSKYDNINVQVIGRHENDDRSLLSVAYPVTENAAINKAVEKFSQEFVDLYTKTAAEQEQSYERYLAETGQKSNTSVADFTQHFDVSFANRTYVSFVFYQYQNTGGTGMSTTFSKIFNRQTGKEIPLQDLFTSTSYLKRFSDISREILINRVREKVKTLDGTPKALADYVENNIQSITEGTEPIPKNFDSVVISDDGILTIYFDKYQVGPGSDGVVSVEIPLTQIADILAPEVRDFFAISKPTVRPAPPLSTSNTNASSSSAVDCNVAKCVALTFDDGPSVYTNQLLDTLQEAGVHATFFILGQSARIQSETVAREAAEGNEVGNHTWDHRQLTTLTPEQIQDEINKTSAIIKQIIPNHPASILLRPPYGSYNEEVVKAASGPIILWSVDPEDWKDRDTAIVTERLSAAPRNSIVLAHDIHLTTVEAIPAVIKNLEARGMTLVTVSQLLAGRDMTAGTVYRKR